MPAIKLGELLVKANVLQEAQLRSALSEQSRWGGRIGEVLVRMTLVTEDLLLRALSKQLGLPVANLDGVVSIASNVLGKLTAEQARMLQSVPLQLKDNGKTLIVAMCEPQNPDVMESLKAVTGCRIMAQLTGRTAFMAAYRRFYDDGIELSELEESFRSMDPSLNARAVTSIELREVTANNLPIPESVHHPEPQDSVTALTPLDEALRMTDHLEVRALIELLIEKGIFTRQELAAKLRR